MLRQRPPCIDVTLVNNDSSSSSSSSATSPDWSAHHHHHDDDDGDTNRYHAQSSPLSSTLRTDGLSIGFDYFRFEGSTVSSISPSRLELEGTIGRGACSVVRLARVRAADRDDDTENADGSRGINDDESSQNNQQRFALKTSPIRDPARRKMMMKELRVLCRLDCDCLVRLVGAFFDIKDGMVTMVRKGNNFRFDGRTIYLFAPTNIITAPYFST